MVRRSALGERLGTDHAVQPGDILGAVDVGSNAVRLKLVRLLEDGAFEALHQERDPVRPGDGIWQTGRMADEVVDRLVAALSRYADLCRLHGARHVRAVATSAVREAKNKDDVVKRVREDCGLELEVISGREEARLIGLGVLRGLPQRARSLLVDIGGGSTELVVGAGEEPTALWSVPLGAVRLSEMFHAEGKVTREQLTSMRRFAQRVIGEAMPTTIKGAPKHAIGSSGTVRAVCAFAAPPGSASATPEDLSRAVEELVALSLAERRKRFDLARARVIIAGAVVLESLAFHLRFATITAVDGGLKEGLLVDLLKRSQQRKTDPLLSEAVVAAGARFGFDEAHALHTRDVALALFDQLESVHHLPPDCRLILEVAAVLHDVGDLVSRSRHHKHSLYLIQHMDLPGISDRERELAGLVARFHRRSPPAKEHVALVGLDAVERRVVRGLVTLLRIADGADHSRQQPVAVVDARTSGVAVKVRLKQKKGKQIEPWDHEVERALFRSCFGKRLEVDVVGGA
ncbi:MAG: Ppx/GppA phosphatase family protein [Deltaproteobacteria bacterium]|nr:Ppx/GppA phosphatase family protein [Deltaproteobacteria bacterium]